MPISRMRLTFVALALSLATCASVAVADDPASSSSPRHDLYGDPLPQGAISRLGTLRYRHPGWYKRVEFLPDRRTFAVGTSDNTVRLWDARSGMMVHEVDINDDYLDAFRLSPDGRSIATLSH